MGKFEQKIVNEYSIERKELKKSSSKDINQEQKTDL